MNKRKTTERKPLTAKTAAKKSNVVELGPIPNATDAAFERETVFVTSDADNCIYVTTSQRPMITALLKNPVFQVEENVSGLLIGKLPLGALTVRQAGKRTRTVKSDRPKRVINAAKCSVTKADGSPCRAIAKKDTGKCFKHS